LIIDRIQHALTAQAIPELPANCVTQIAGANVRQLQSASGKQTGNKPPNPVVAISLVDVRFRDDALLL
jgi:hypothetical protein